MCHHHRYWPQLDLFANRKNRQTPKFCSWRVDKKSQGNAWDQNWGLSRNWLNPPWNLVGRALRKLKEDKATALCCLPVWKTAPWWYQLKGLLKDKPTMVEGTPLYQNPKREDMPAPRWATLFAVLDASQGHKSPKKSDKWNPSMTSQSCNDPNGSRRPWENTHPTKKKNSSEG